MRLRTRYAFDELDVERLESESLAENLRMHRALEKSGYRRMGTKRHFIYRGGTWHDMHIFEVLRDEWRAEQT